jgi:predicted nucleotidyltransferase
VVQPSTTAQGLADQAVLRLLRRELPYLRRRFGVTRLALYGSHARGSQTEGSDVDILVELSRPLGLEFVALAQYPEDRLGRPVDLATFDAFRQALQQPYRRAIAAAVQEDLIDVETAPR